MDTIFKKRGGLAALSTLNMRKIKTNDIAIMQKEEKTQERKGRKKWEGGQRYGRETDEKYILKKKPQKQTKKIYNKYFSS